MLNKLFLFIIGALCTIVAIAQEPLRHIVISADGVVEKTIVLTEDLEIKIDRTDENNLKFSVDGVKGDEITFQWLESKIEDVVNDESEINILYVDRVITIEGYEGDYFIYDLNGHLVNSGQATYPIDVTSFAKGIYILVVNKQTLKFIKS